ncbi:helix-turn-helix domain-containing protein [Microbulbifer rhizosphaerae]|uniref:Transcriptional regulator with XRE-family HTH domain n=1 Tax=Microbulbifer rhizosphaerae TaxID=1562603 RepID=A0A7W4WE05_9GAMM|nr:helix-turn-helix transcriptional regulator [Microbulbifer rhizosphaerae]MBB3062484.1 transcriptional regulator with XRE-family HTH domain [Microbulbifer rhizosphaerae]
MNFGEKLKQLRQDQNLTQPQLAEAVGIEQSYLSKLENEKCLPSSDVFSRILEVFQLGVGDFFEDLNHRSRLQLRQIPEVAHHFDQQKQLIIGNRRRWLLGSALLLAIGAALIYSGATKLFVPAIVYQYMSHGIVAEGEPKELFSILELSCTGSACERRASLEERIDEDFLTTRRFRGDVFNIPVEGGSRTYYRKTSRSTDPWQNKAVAAFGVLLTFLGLTGIALEKKLSRFE